MYEVSDDYLEVVNGLRSRSFHIRCKFDGLEGYITEDNIPAGTYTNIIDGNSVVSMGNACSNKVEMTIQNFATPYVWKGSRFAIENGLSVLGAVEWVPWGTFWVADMSTSNDKRTIKLTAYDYMFKLSKTKYATLLAAPFHYRDLLDEFLTNTGMTLSTTAELPAREDADYMILSWPEGEFSFADIAGHLAGMVGCNARVSTADPTVMEFVWYTATGTKIQDNLYQDGFEKLSDSALRVDYFVTGANKEIEIENTEESTEGDLDFRPFDSADPADHPWLIFTYDDATLTASVQINPDYASELNPFRIPYSVLYNGNTYTVTSIPSNGFSGCMATEIVLPDTLQTIDWKAFDGCGNISELTIPESVTGLGWYLVCNCPLLKTVYYNAINASTISQVSSWQTIFGKYGTDNENPSYVEQIIVGGGVEVIPTAFARWATNLTYVNIPTSVTSIGAGAFDSTGISTITIPENVVGIGDDIFEACGNLKTINYNAINAARTGSADANAALFGKDCGVETVVVSYGVQKIPEYLCRKCYSLTSVNIPITVTTIGVFAFAECTSLSTLTIPKYVTTIGHSIIRECTSFGTLYYNAISAVHPESYVSGRTVFGKSGVKSIVVGDGVVELPAKIAQSCTELTYISISSTVETIPTNAFTDSTAIANIDIDKPVDSISGSPWGATNAVVTWLG